MSIARGWCWTWHKPDCELDPAMFPKWQRELFEEHVAFGVWQLEQCQESKEDEELSGLHYQGYFEFKSPQRMTMVKRVLGNQTVHCEKRKGSQKQAYDYCTKADTRVEGPYKFGEAKLSDGQGKRSDLARAAEDASDINKHLVDVILDNPTVAMRYSKGISTVRAAAVAKAHRDRPAGEQTRQVDCLVYWGATGVGKTRKAMEEKDVFILPAKEGKSTTWFDGYMGQKVLVVDEFTPDCIGWDLLLRICDIYPLQVPIKGGFVAAEWNKVIITSNYHPDKWYPAKPSDERGPLRRRIRRVIELKKAIPANQEGIEEEPVWADESEIID